MKVLKKSRIGDSRSDMGGFLLWILGIRQESWDGKNCFSFLQESWCSETWNVSKTRSKFSSSKNVTLHVHTFPLNVLIP